MMTLAPSPMLKRKKGRTPASARRLLLALGLIGLIAGGGAVIWASHAEAPPAAKAPAGSVEAAPDTTVAPHPIVAYYFHTTRRCASCRKIEAYTREAIETGFAEAIANRRLSWRVVNVEEKGNEHFVKDYKLFTKSVVLVERSDSADVRWRNLPKVWELLGDKAAFMSYVQEETRAYLAGRD